MAQCNPHKRSIVVAHRAIILLLVFALSSSAAFAHSVTMNFRFHIVDINDVTHSATNYVSAERNGILAALIAGSALTNITLDKAADPYLFKLKQDENQNRFLLAVTNGTWQKIESKPAGKVPATTFGDLALPAAATGLALQLQFDGIDLTGIVGPAQVLVKSLGKTRIPVISLSIVG